ncbi:uncharacterized protein LOC112344705 [Selaginella moellendorffii]|uniref:uncharacterized protein LOC112344705 n=1 Tax=Selaginella moellendorffii TaxID=88036 RepID=UPI000D1D01E5|nr:uncharacterized protein LOC112344705 [Selaginella moellendorffii]|eukprot:XP_024525784.1 uncharacterized protein LOC112344705 [Selaginella moellendorffii]
MDETSIIRGINSAIKKSEGRFCCGGSLPLPQEGIGIWYTKENDSHGHLHLPVEPYDDTGIEELLDETANLQEGHLVHELDPHSFATNFDLGKFFIMDEITKLLGPGTILRAQLHKLTVIVTGGERELNDSMLPNEEGDVFGYLIVGLPFSFTGGEVMVRKSGSKLNTFSTWDTTESIHWVAFIAGCDHLITEVTSGYQITLTYKLFRLVDSNKRKRVVGVNDTLVDAHTLPLYELWIEATNNANFYPDGGVLGFACQQQYEVSDELRVDGLRDDKTWLLKGADAMLFAAAKAAGLEVELKPVYKNSESENPALLYLGKVVGEKAPGFLGEFREGFDDLDRDTTAGEELPRGRDGVKTDANLKWCLRNFAWITGKECGRYRTEQVDVSWFHSSAVVVTIPPWSERKGSIEKAEEEVPEAKKAKIYKEAIADWFRRAEEQATREVADSEYRANSDEEEEEEENEDEDEEDDEGDDEEEGDGDGDGDEEEDGDGDGDGGDGGVKEDGDPLPPAKDLEGENGALEKIPE